MGITRRLAFESREGSLLNMQRNSMMSVPWISALCVGLLGFYGLCLALVPLAGDEAYYWLWSSLVSLGYVDHPPGVAWLGWLGGLTRSVFVFRLCGSLAVLAAFVWSAQLIVKRGERWGKESWLVLLVLLSAPLTSHFLVEMGPDSLLILAWALCLKSLNDAVLEERELGWWGLSLGLSLAVYSKLTGWLAWGSTLGWLISVPEGRQALKKKRFWLQLLFSVALLVPHFAWNQRHQWINYLFQFKLRKSAVVFTSANLLKPFETLADCGLLTLLMIPAAIWAVRAVFSSQNPQGVSAPVLRLLIWFSLPLQVCFALFRLMGVGRWNWALPSYLGLSVLLVLWVITNQRQKWLKLALLGSLFWSLAAVALRSAPNLVADGSTLGSPSLAATSQQAPSRLLRLRNSDYVAAYPELGRQLSQWKTAHGGFLMSDDYTEASALSYYSGAFVHLVAPFQEGSQFVLFNDFESKLSQDALLVSRRKLEDLPHVLVALQRSFESYRRETPIEIDIGSRKVIYYPVFCHNLKRAMLQADPLGIRASDG